MSLTVKHQTAHMQTSTRLKPREKLKEFGIKNLTNIELLALILGSGSSKLSVFELSHQVFKEFSLKKLAKLSVKKIALIPGLGQVKAGQILAAIELGKRSNAPISPLPKIIKPHQVANQLKDISHKKREHVICLYLNGRYELVHRETVAVGGLNYSMLEARDVFAPALRIPAPYVILGHNHPSGSIKPSQEDLKVTNKLKQAGELLGITLLDHVVVSGEKYGSIYK